MAIHAPTTQLFPNGVVTITSLDSTSYESILESLGSKQYIMTDVYIQSNDVEQILEPIGFFKYDSNGNIADNIVVPTVDPNQDQFAINIEFKTKAYILDGKLYIDYNIRPMEQVNFYIGNITAGNSDFLPPNKTFDDKFLKDYGFFEDYSDTIAIKTPFTIPLKTS